MTADDSRIEMADDDQLPWAVITATDSDEWDTSADVRGKHEVDIDERREAWGNDEAPTPGDYLLIATAGCQVEVLKMCLEKARVDDYEIEMYVERDFDPDAGPETEPYPSHTSIRVTDLNMELSVTTTEEFEDRVQRCLSVCEDACIISKSVERGIDINLTKESQVAEPDDE